MPNSAKPAGTGRVVVTGGAGFIGSHLVERLLRDGKSVVVIDDFSTGSRDNLAAVAEHRALEIHPGKVSETDLGPRFEGAEAIFHLAAAVGVDLVVRSPIRTIETNLHETEVLLRAAAKAGVPVLLASTSEVYGKSTREEFGEEDDLLIGPPTHARWSYACSKLTDEFLCLAYMRERGLPVTIARLFNTVGPRQTGRYGMVLPRFIAAASEDRPLRVFGDGRQTRCFCYVTDTVEALVRLGNAPAARGEVFNVGTTVEVSIRELAGRVIRLMNSKSEIEFVPYSEAYAPGFDDFLRRRPVVEKLARVTGFRPATPLDETILRTAGRA
jgi:UDP-glucose 4-epimerase